MSVNAHSHCSLNGAAPQLLHLLPKEFDGVAVALKRNRLVLLSFDFGLLEVVLACSGCFGSVGWLISVCYYYHSAGWRKV